MNRSVVVLVLLVGCHRDRDERVLPPASSPSPAQVASSEPVARAPAQPALGGVVVETMDASTYTYARLDQGGTEIWIAGPRTALAVGIKLEHLEGTLMTDFHSNTLDRTFAQIYFVNGFGAGVAPVAEPMQPAASGKETVAGTVIETMDAGGYTYALIDQQGTKVWIAGPATKLAVGAKLGAMSGTLMTAFHSSTLNRTFDQIYFVGAYSSVR
jgi:hypothetical protein